MFSDPGPSGSAESRYSLRHNQAMAESPVTAKIPVFVVAPEAGTLPKPDQPIQTICVFPPITNGEFVTEHDMLWP